MARFPRAGSSEPKESDPMMKRVDLDHAEIGSRPSGMPKEMNDRDMKISHVGGSTGKSG